MCVASGLPAPRYGAVGTLLVNTACTWKCAIGT